MIVGTHCLDPRRVVGSHYELHSNINGNIIYAFGIQYLLGSQLETKIQFGTLDECIKWNKIINKYIGKDSLADLISDRQLNIEDEDDEMTAQKIGFNTND